VAVPIVSAPAPAQETFLWVAQGDASARRKARAHVTRGFRRQKAEAEAAKLAAKEKVAAEIPPTDSSHDPSKAEDIVQNSKEYEDTASAQRDVVRVNSEPLSSRFVKGAKRTTQDYFILANTLGAGKKDPFDSLPVKLDAGGHAILEHCE